MKLTSSALLLLLALSAGVLAQTPEPKRDDPNRPPSERGRSFNYEEFRQRMAERLKTSLKVTDDEWSVLQPLIEKVQSKQRDAFGGRFGSRGPGEGGGPPGFPGGSSSSSGTPRPGSAERDALRTALENENASPEELKAKLAAVRQVREKNAAELAAAREDLKKVLTVRQEAVLVAFGILE